LQGRWLMIGTTGATVLLIINIALASVVGVVTGGLTCLVLRQPWSLKTVLLDAALAACVGLVAAYALATIEAARGVWGSLVGLVLAIAAVSIIVAHIVRLSLRSPH
jgi:hypothetical protein